VEDIKTGATAAFVVVTLFGFAGTPLMKAALGDGHPAYNAIVIVVLGLLSLGVSALGAINGLDFVTENFVTIFIGCWVASCLSIAGVSGGAQVVGRGLGVRRL
jgi:hypothetical protein